jgi:hypothetical protein
VGSLVWNDLSEEALAKSEAKTGVKIAFYCLFNKEPHTKSSHAFFIDNAIACKSMTGFSDLLAPFFSRRRKAD